LRDFDEEVFMTGRMTGYQTKQNWSKGQTQKDRHKHGKKQEVEGHYKEDRPA
jgi:hypothetical protein